jgi:chemotaxis family two-component system response regulator Rcp1
MIAHWMSLQNPGTGDHKTPREGTLPSTSSREAASNCAKIALVEDNPADIFLFKLALTAPQVSAELIVMEEDGEAGFDFIRQVEDGSASAPQVFILDMSLPRHNGAELIDRIRRSPACASVRIIVASSSQSPRDRAAAAEHGADRYFVKPSNFDDFMKIGEIVSDLLSS